MTKPKTVGSYLRTLKDSKKDKPQQIKDALDIYIGLWERILSKGIVADHDDVETALAKIDASGGLLQAAGD